MADANQREFVARLFPEVKRSMLRGLAHRVTRLELSEPGIVNLRQQAAMCVERGILESGRRSNGVWQPFWNSTPGTVFNTDALLRKRRGPGMHRVVKRVTLLLLTADAYEAELAATPALRRAVRASMMLPTPQGRSPEAKRRRAR